jgi:hypothetical protein
MALSLVTMTFEQCWHAIAGTLNRSSAELHVPDCVAVGHLLIGEQQFTSAAELVALLCMFAER